jgi:hypothetical protein
MVERCDEAPSGRNVDIALLTELASSIASVTINITLLTELGKLSTHNTQLTTGH